MHDKVLAACISHCADKVAHKVVALDAVNANAVLDGNGRVLHRITHGFDAICHQCGGLHQASTKSATLHAVARAAAVEVDFVIAPLLAHAGALREHGGVTAAQLQGYGVLFGVVAQMALRCATHNCAHVNHLGIQQRLLAQ